MAQDESRGSDILVYTLVRENDQWKLKFPPTIKQMLLVIEEYDAPSTIITPQGNGRMCLVAILHRSSMNRSSQSM